MELPKFWVIFKHKNLKINENFNICKAQRKLKKLKNSTLDKSNYLSLPDLDD